jgi:tetratricopeptide (TPR) repeat protein
VTLSSPTRFGRYVVLDILTGDPGEVTLLAFDPQLDRKVGLKVFDELTAGEGTHERRDRARVLANLVHPHVVRVHDVGTREGRLFVAMDFVEGVTFDVWCAREHPDPRRIVEVLAAAAEGLAAAHEAGLVHGNFSPNTLVIGDDGQIRVLDFVRSAEDHRDGAMDETRDRIDVCTTLHEALFGSRPGSSDGELPPPPADSKVPMAVRRVLLAGLREGQPHPTMRELATQLRRAVRGRKLAWGGALAAVAVGATALALFASPGDDLPKRSWCDGVDAKIEAVWNDEIARGLHTAFVATNVTFAEEAWGAVSEDVERFVTAWRAAEREDCARGVTAAKPAISLCLHRQYESLRTFAAALQQPDGELVANAARTAASLGDPSSCAAETETGFGYGDVQLDRVMQIESLLSASQVQRELSKYDQSIASGLEARAQAQAAGLKWWQAEADYQVARSRAIRGDEEDAERGFHDAFSEAVASRHGEMVARSSMELAQLLAEQGRHDEASRWIEHARGAVQTHDSLSLRIRLAAVEGAAAYRRGDYAEARDHFARSGELAMQTERPDPFARIHAAKMGANAVGRLGDTQAEVDMLLESLEYTEAKLGPDHPNVAHHLNSLASAYARQGNIDEALAANERAVAIFERVFGPDHSNTIMGLTNLAGVLHEAGRDEEAEVAYARGLKAAEANFPPDDARRITILANVGMFYSLTGRYEEAARYLADAAERSEAINGPDHSFTLGYLNNLAATYMFGGSDEKARDVYRELLGRTERVLGPEHPQMTPCLLGLATVEATLGHPDVAVPLLRRALEIATDRNDRPERVGSVQFHLAQVLWDTGSAPAEALEIARGARLSYAAAAEGGWDVGDRDDEIRKWLAERE